MSVVVRVIGPAEIKDRRDALCAWLGRNGIDYTNISDHWLSLEREDGMSVLRCQVFRLDVNGRRLVHPENRDRVWKEEQVYPLTETLPEDFGEPYSMHEDNWNHH